MKDSEKFSSINKVDFRGIPPFVLLLRRTMLYVYKASSEKDLEKYFGGVNFDYRSQRTALV